MSAIIKYLNWHSPLLIPKILEQFDCREKVSHQLAKLLKSEKFNEADVSQVHYLLRLQKFENQVNEAIIFKDVAACTNAYRNKTYLCVDVIWCLSAGLTSTWQINLILRAGLYFQSASCYSKNADAMPDQRLAEESVHRFWIEVDTFPIALPEEENVDRNIEPILFGTLKMVVRKHRLMRDAQGKLVDDPNEKQEGWPIYVTNISQLSTWQSKNTNEKITLPERAMIFLRGQEMLYFFEEGMLSDPIPLPSPYRSRLNRLFQHKRQPDGQVIKTAENSPFLFSLTCSIAQFSKRPDHFTAEYIFATAFTNHYDEFARYFPEFGRLKALSRMMILVRFLKGIRKQNDANQKRLQKILNNPDHEIWNKGRAESLINSFTAIWKKHILKSEVDRLSREKDGAGLFLTKQSPEVRAECQKIFETRKANYIDQNGWFSRFDQTCPKLEDVIEKEAPSVIVRLQKENRPKFEANARKKYGRKLQDCWPGSYSVYINLYLKGNAVPLAFALAVAEKNREHEIQFQSLKKELGIALSDNECLSVLLGEEKIAIMVVKQIRRNPKSALIKAWSTQEKTIRDQLTAQIEKCKRLCESLKALKLGKESEEKNIDGICSWVPAVSDQNVSGNRYRFVYGGVSLNPHVQIYKGNDPRAQAIARRVTQDQQVARVSATNLAAQRERLANNLRAANLRSSNLAQQYRLYEQAQFFNRRGDGSSSGRTGGVGHGSSTSTPAPAPPGGGSGSGNGGDDGGSGKGLNYTSPYDLMPTEGISMSKRGLKKFVECIKREGIREPICYVVYNGKKFVVNGHHRLRAAKILGIKKVPTREVTLPYKGYNNIDDLLNYFAS